MCFEAHEGRRATALVIWYVKLKRGLPDEGLEESRATYTAFSVILAAGILVEELFR